MRIEEKRKKIRRRKEKWRKKKEKHKIAEKRKIKEKQATALGGQTVGKFSGLFKLFKECHMDSAE